ncbi:uncharacterized protein LOC103580384 isoform X4 [Microplitis demolitor]|uniref:uncharacterized protein LOC103580384 isoform X4 n=1 Tax=Microplitis demolitor TaxID=69319 RepID=UPI00235B6F10|nr:uncharacterized protein LOC103580384 isoform X4 [Microplitis demolitor]
MNEESRCGELQQLVREEEEEEPEETTINPGGEVTPPTTPAKSKPATNNYIPHASSQQVLWESNTQTSPIISKTSSEQATSQGSMVSGKVNNTSHGINQQHLLQQSRLMYVNEKDKQRSNKSDFTGRSRQHRARNFIFCFIYYPAQFNLKNKIKSNTKCPSSMQASLLFVRGPRCQKNGTGTATITRRLPQRKSPCIRKRLQHGTNDRNKRAARKISTIALRNRAATAATSRYRWRY